MPDLKNLIDGAIKLADMADNFIPGASNVTAALNIGKSIIGVIDTLTADANPADQAAMQARRAKLAATVKAKAAATSARLRG